MIYVQNRGLKALIYGQTGGFTGGLVDWNGLEDLSGISHTRFSRGGRRIITSSILNAVDISCTAVSPMAVYMSRQGLGFFIRFV